MFTFFKKVFSPLSKKIRALFAKTPDESSFEHLEQIFYEADLGATTALELVQKVKALYQKSPAITTDQVFDEIKKELLKHFQRPIQSTHIPHVILVVGVNGSGKTTSLAKLAHHYSQQGKKVILAAADTFRAAAIDQLQSWAQRLNVDLIHSKPNSDPSGVVFDALSAAKARGADIVLIDTAGRLQTKTDLMHELAKIRKVCQKQIPESPHETLLVLDATVGQNGIDQAKIFHAFTPLTGIILTKLDGTAKGGIAFAIQKQLQIPICWIATGEQVSDISPFSPEEYVTALFS